MIPSSGEIPEKRYGCASAIIGDYLYIFAGAESEGIARDFEIYRFHFSNFHCFITYNLVSKTWKKVVGVYGKPPMGRHYHIVVKHPIEDSVFIFGGKSNGYCNDLHRFDLGPFSSSLTPTDTLTWTPIVPKGEIPSRRYGHTVVTHNKKAYIAGGSFSHFIIDA